MPLVAYSDSEGSSDEQEVSSRGDKTSNSKTSFRPIVDRSNPRKIEVNLRERQVDELSEAGSGDGPALKRARTSGAFTGFNSLLPPPKRSTARNVNCTSQKAAGEQRKPFSLKTGSEPAFSRDGMELSDTVTAEIPTTLQVKDAELETTAGVPKKGNPVLFKPLSVARNAQKKKPPTPAPPKSTSLPQAKGEADKSVPQAPSKVSLFPVSKDVEAESETGGHHDALLHRTNTLVQSGEAFAISNEDEVGFGDNEVTEHSLNASTRGGEPVPPPSHQSLDSIAADLNLSAAAKRQLLGRQAKAGVSPSTINVVNFNTDTEYAANEALRASGEQVQHNPVRAIAPGKHSLKQLFNAAAQQKDALEEHFATGKRNKREAGSKYGW